MKGEHMSVYEQRIQRIAADYQRTLNLKNNPVEGNGVFERFEHPVLTAAHIPPAWKYDLNPATNPLLLERMGVNCVFNPGAMEFDGKVVLVARVEGNDRKSFFAVAESDSGVDGFRFWSHPIRVPQTDDWDVNAYDMRLVRHEDGWIYGLFCSERRDPDAPATDTSAAVAQCGIVRTHDLKNWERLPDLQTPSPQQRNVVLHPKFIGGKYALYTRPQDGFISTGSGGGIAWGLCHSMENPVVDAEILIDPRDYHTIKEVKNGQGPAPVWSPEGWIHVAHGVRNTAAGLRYVLYVFMTAMEEPWRVIRRPGGFFLAPEGEERIGDVSNVAFCNGLVQRADGTVLIYYASSDTRCHVARTSVERLLDYCKNTPKDPLFSHLCVEQRCAIIDSNIRYLETLPDDSALKQLL